MINLANVRDFFMLMGSFTPQDADRCNFIIKNSIEYIQRKLKLGTDMDANRERIEIAAAGHAYCDFLTLGLKDQGEEIKLGSLFVKNSSGGIKLADIDSMRKYYITQISDLTTDNFVFIAVGGN